jgi:dTMP kinase
MEYNKMGLFITFEGIDGCGKSTQIKLLHKNLTDHGYTVTLTREPGGTSLSEKIRSIILDVNNSRMSSRCELLLYLAARAQHIDEKILPDIDQGKIVLSDRFEEATFAYQGCGRDIGTQTIIPLNAFATRDLIPDLTFVLDIPVEESERRFIASGKVRDRLELNDREFFTKIRNGYLRRVHLNNDRMICINGELSIKEIESIIRTRVFGLIHANSTVPSSSKTKFGTGG